MENFRKDFEQYVEYCLINSNVPVLDIIRHVDVNYIIPLKSELFEANQLLKEVSIVLRNGGYDDSSEFVKLYLKIEEHGSNK